MLFQLQDLLFAASPKRHRKIPFQKASDTLRLSGETGELIFLESVSFLFSFCLSFLNTHHLLLSEKASFCTSFLPGGYPSKPPLFSDITILPCYVKYFLSAGTDIHRSFYCLNTAVQPKTVPSLFFTDADFDHIHSPFQFFFF